MNAKNIIRMLAYKRRLILMALLETSPMTCEELCVKLREHFSVVTMDLHRLYVLKKVYRDKRYDEKSKRSLYLYSIRNKTLEVPNVVLDSEEWSFIDSIDSMANFQKVREDLDRILNDKGIKKHVIVDSKNPNKTTYLNMSRPGSDYSWQRPKKKSSGASIGSSFAMFDGFA